MYTTTHTKMDILSGLIIDFPLFADLATSPYLFQLLLLPLNERYLQVQG